MQRIEEHKLSKGFENELLKHIKDVNDALNEKPAEKDRDEVVLYYDSIVPQLRSLPVKKCQRLKMDIDRLIFQKIYDERCPGKIKKISCCFGCTPKCKAFYILASSFFS